MSLRSINCKGVEPEWLSRAISSSVGIHSSVAVEIVCVVIATGEKPDLLFRVARSSEGRPPHCSHCTGIADGIAEVEDIRRSQARIGSSLDHHLEPFLLDGVVVPKDAHAIRAATTCTGPHRDLFGTWSNRPVGWKVIVAYPELEVGGAQTRRVGQTGNVYHNAIDAAAVAGVVGEGGRLTGQQGLFVGSDL